jgi:predicted phage replisome organizer
MSSPVGSSQSREVECMLGGSGMANKYFWLKLFADFFERPEIQLLEAMPNGKEYIILYFKLLCKSCGSEGYLRFSEMIPYNEQMISTITHTNVDVVRSALKAFVNLNMVEILDDGTFYMHEVANLIGSAVNSPAANRQRRHREKKKLNQKRLTDGCVTKCHAKCDKKSLETDLETETEIETDIDIETDKDIEFDLLTKIKSVCQSRALSIDPVQIYEQIKQNNTKVKNLEKYLVSVDEYQKAEKKQSGSGTKFNDNFHQRDYDFDDLERQLLSSERGE